MGFVGTPAVVLASSGIIPDYLVNVWRAYRRRLWFVFSFELFQIFRLHVLQ